uniref:Barrier-to-autointegration factor n=1 Tax=Oncorhynchus tshawytscha TaxID=74940 RepID=A0A8C8LWD4_ONCTS
MVGPPTTSQKHQSFVTEPMGNRSVRDVPGIGPAHGRTLEERGMPRADQLLGDYLKRGRDKGQFQENLKEYHNAKQQWNERIASWLWLSNREGCYVS